jgi:hypothetical protein
MEGNGRALQEKILKLRLQKKSYREIAAILDIAKSTVGYWVADDPQSLAVKEELTQKNYVRSRVRLRRMIVSARARWAREHAETVRVAWEFFLAHARNPLFVAGLMLYWGEGDSKQKNPLRLSNTDCRMIASYVDFLRSLMHIPDEKIRVGLVLYPDLSDTACKKFWSDVTGLPEENFVKTQYIKGRHPTKRLAHGICMVVVNKRSEKLKMLSWIDFFSKQYKMNP